jgi:dipeptidyl-peptidase-4
VTSDGETVIFGRHGGVWTFDVASGRELQILARADAYALAGRTVALVDNGRLHVADIGEPARAHDTPGPAVDPRPDPTGRRVGYLVAGGLHVLDRTTGRSTLLAHEADNPGVSWGAPEAVARQSFARSRGYWWSPDGESVLASRVDLARVRPADPRLPYPTAGTPTAEVSLHLLDLDGGWVDVHWDRETYPYLASVSWSDVGGPLVTVLRRLQQHGLVLAVDPRTGETQVHAELADPRWVRPIAGTPAYLPDGRVLIGGELAHDGYDARCLFADGALLTPPGLYVRRVCGRLGPDLLVEASEGEPSERHLYRVSTRVSAISAEVARMTTEPGWHRGACGGDTVAIGASSMDHDGIVWTIAAAGRVVGRLRSHPVAGPPAPRPSLGRVTDRRLPAAVLYPLTHAGGRLPVLVEIAGTPDHQGVVAARAPWRARQWWADQGFAVVVIDQRGTPGIAPSFEKIIHRRVGDIVLADQVDALVALAEKHPDLDLGRVAAMGAGFGGFVAALAAVRRPEMYRGAVVVTPVADWALAESAFAERLLGPPQDAVEAYAHNSLIEMVAEPVLSREVARPLMLVECGNPTPHIERLAAALASSRRPFERAHSADRRVQLDFLRRLLL